MNTDTSIIIAIVGALSTIVATVITNNSTRRAVEAQLEKQQAVTDTKVEELTREVREHNNFARRMPVVEEQIAELRQHVSVLEMKGA